MISRNHPTQKTIEAAARLSQWSRCKYGTPTADLIPKLDSRPGCRQPPY